MHRIPVLRVLFVVVMLLTIVGSSVAVTPSAAVAQDTCPTCQPIPEPHTDCNPAFCPPPPTDDCVGCGPADETPQERRERIRAEIRAQVDARIAEARTRLCTSLPWAPIR